MSSDEPDPPTPDPAEDAVRRALGARASEVTMSPDALDRIRNRRPSRGIAGRTLALAGVAAVVALLVGVAVVTGGDDEPEGTDVAGTTTTTEPPPATTEPRPSTTTAAPAANDAVTRVREGYAVWPTDDAGAPTAEAAASGWAEETIGFVSDALTEEPAVPLHDDVRVFSFPFVGEGGQLLGDGIAITVASPDGGEHWLVESVGSADLTIDRVEWLEGSDSPRRILVHGTGSAFEGTGLLSVDRSEPVIVGLGAFEPAPFVAEIPVSGDGPFVVHLETGRAFSGEVPHVASIAVDPEPATSEWVVVGVADDDVLNVRDGVGTDAAIVATLAPDARGIQATGRGAANSDGASWREVVTPDGVTGWANDAFVAFEIEPTAAMQAAMIAEARRFLASFGDPGAEPAIRHPDGIDIGGIGVFADAPTPFAAVDDPWSDEIRDWNPFPQAGPCDDVCLLTTTEFLDVRARDIADAAYSIGPDIDPGEPNFSFFTGLDPGYYDRLATVVAYVPPVDEGELDWKRYTFGFDFADGTAVIRSVWRWGWTP